ncbi:MAG: hypothetical protein JSU70_22870 [Phycisphaerales bacterium]|nr:MAG: hypothetical protein JSU70_22870 [Phycisphaerales bacterium]
MARAARSLVLHNPLIRRYRYSMLRASSFWIYLTIYASVVILLLFINSTSRHIIGDSLTDEEYYRGIVSQFLVIQAIILWVWAALNSRSALRDEVANKTYDFFRLLPLSALQKAFGILLGKNLLALLFATVTFVPIIIFGFLAGMSVAFQAQVIFLLLSIAVFINSLALLSSSTAPRKQNKTSIVVWILLLILVGPCLLPALGLPFSAVSRIYRAEGYLVKFFTIELPILLLIALIGVYFGFWNILGIVRNFTREREPLFSRKAAFAFLFGYGLIAVGLLVPHLSDHEAALYCLWLVWLVPLVLIPATSVSHFDSYLECCGLRRLSSDSLEKGMTATLLRHSNLTLAIGLLAAWAVASALVGPVSQIGPSRYLADILVICSFYLFLVLLLELGVVYIPVYKKIALLLGFLAVLHLLLPLILSFALKLPALRLYSLFGFFSHIISASATESPATRLSIIIVNMLLCAGPVLLIWKRYAHILTLRRRM